MKKKILICAALMATVVVGCASNRKESSSAAKKSSKMTTTTAASDTSSQKPLETTPEQSSAETTTVSAVSEQETENVTENISSRSSIYDDKIGLLSSIDELKLHDVDGNNTSFEFYYDGETYTAQYTPDNWKIVDSYKIRNSADMLLICEALIEINPLHGRDMVSYRVPEEMVDEWMQHNLAYDMFKDNAALRARAKDVDLNPDDQGKNIIEKYMEIADLF